MFASHAAEMASFHQMTVSCRPDDLGRVFDPAVELADTIVRSNVGDPDHMIEMSHPGLGMCCFIHWVIFL